LFIANADNNDVMVVDISSRLLDEARGRGEPISIVNGFIPVGWYPTAVAVSPDGGTLFVANGKGLASRANFPARLDASKRPGRELPYDPIGRTLEGSIAMIDRPTDRKSTRLNSSH